MQSEYSELLKSVKKHQGAIPVIMVRRVFSEILQCMDQDVNWDKWFMLGVYARGKVEPSKCIQLLKDTTKDPALEAAICFISGCENNPSWKLIEMLVKAHCETRLSVYARGGIAMSLADYLRENKALSNVEVVRSLFLSLALPSSADDKHTFIGKAALEIMGTNPHAYGFIEK